MYGETRDQGFGAEVKRRIMLGTYALSAGYYDAYYLQAQKVRTLIRRDFDQAFERCDLVAGPVSPTAAFRLGEKVDDPLQMYLADIFTISANLAALPGPLGAGRTSPGVDAADRAPAGRASLRRADPAAGGPRAGARDGSVARAGGHRMSAPTRKARGGGLGRHAGHARALRRR